MSEQRRTTVRVRRSPRIGVFLLAGALLGVLIALAAVSVTPGDASMSRPQAIGFLALLLAPLGAAVGAVVALVGDRVSERRARTVEAERISPPAVEAEAPAGPPAAEVPAPVDEDVDRT